MTGATRMTMSNKQEIERAHSSKVRLPIDFRWNEEGEIPSPLECGSGQIVPNNALACPELGL